MLLKYRKRLLGALVVALCVAPLALVNGNAAAAATLPPQPGTFKGYGFDACTAPSSAAMKAWLTSPYRAVGIYFGGNNRGCAQPNLTASWVREQIGRGWRLIPLYVGPQATCTTTTKKNRIDNANAEIQGRAIADDAVAQAKAIGLSRESVLIYDMEAYRTNDAACRNGVLAFMKGWTARLHDHGYFSGFYSSVSSGVADQVAVYNKAGYVRPDYMDFARWDQVVTTADKVIPSSYWTPGRRMKQYRGDHKETWGGVTINIDNDYLDFARLPSAKFGDWTRNGWPDVLARTRSSGNLISYPGNGSYVSEANRTTISGGFAAMNAILRMDLNRDGYEDIVARSTAGVLYFYPGTSNGRLGTRKVLYKKFTHVRELTAIGDFNRDGYPDMLATQMSNGDVYLYPGKKGAKFGARKAVAYGNWADRSEFTGVGDYNRDGYADLLVRVTKTGALHLYPGKGNGFKTRVGIGRLTGFRDITGTGDFDRDGFTDVIAVQSSTGHLMLFRGTGKNLRAGVRLATGYQNRTPLF
ncbi:glycoside hydrolase domain-containing protein [Actinoplanes missouriensis]|nr:glycoside hydrolase domain-containing protein [Actinoplanes missouriensis]